MLIPNVLYMYYIFIICTKINEIFHAIGWLDASRPILVSNLPITDTFFLSQFLRLIWYDSMFSFGTICLNTHRTYFWSRLEILFKKEGWFCYNLKLIPKPWVKTLLRHVIVTTHLNKCSVITPYYKNIL